MKIGEMQLQNRFVRSATGELMAYENGKISSDLIKMYQTLSKGEIGLIITGFMYIHPSGKCVNNQIGIDNNEMIPGLQKLSDAVHQWGSKIAFQLVHSGLQTKKEIVGFKPKGPSGGIRNPITFSKSKQMTEEDINTAIRAFSEAAWRAAEAGADAVQLHCAHGYLINQFLSPFFNRRSDEWGGSEENRFRFLKEVFIETRKVISKDKPILVKLSTCDYTKKEGVTPLLAKNYAQRLVALGVDAVEVSAGGTYFAYMNMCRGKVPIEGLLRTVPKWQKPLAKILLQKMDKSGKYDLQEGYNLEAANIIKPVLKEYAVPLILVGGLRRLAHMEEIIMNDQADFISLCRPFIRDPLLLKKFKEGNKNKSDCISCNQCLSAAASEIPVRCYVKKLPSKAETEKKKEEIPLSI